MLQIATKSMLDRRGWHKPLVSVIVTHHNYSHHVRDALLSVLDQTYENWECVVVDDGSEQHHRDAIKRIVEDIGSCKIRLLQLRENVGQTPAAYAGLDNTRGEFVCILDPDDRYAETFLEDAVAGHLNETVYCPVLSTDQYLVMNGSVVAGTVTWHRQRFIVEERGNQVVPERPPVRLLFFPSEWGGWHWPSTSCIMFRRSAMELMRPKGLVICRTDVDAYLAQGAHQLGGTLFLTKSLVYRTVHGGNAFMLSHVLSAKHNHIGKHDGQARLRLKDALAAIKANGGEVYLEQAKANPHRRRGLRGLPTRLGHSFSKRWRRWRRQS